MTDKSGGDTSQLNLGGQFNASGSEVKGVGSAGPAILDSLGGAGVAAQGAAQEVAQALNQGNFGFSGSGGNDNVDANTNITVG